MKNKIGTRTLALLCALFLLLGNPALAVGDEDILYINDALDLRDLAARCAYDAWSEGKTVRLQRDISLSGVDFAPIPSFGGTFEGNGHKISGLNIDDSVSPAGLFGVIAATGIVNDLTVEGVVAPGGSAKRVGGVAGENRGTLNNCAFTGTVDGAESVGGVAGVNAVTGTLRRCQANGGVFGKGMTGGIVGENHGTVSFCTNRAYVNTNTLDPSLSFDKLEMNMAAGLSGLMNPESFNITVDSGGVAGYSDGSLLGSVNYGSVGYQHVGYNVGGVAGRSSGHVSTCTNYGSIYGRREVGGVVGTAEPHVQINVTQSSLEEVRRQLDALSKTVDKTVSDAESASDTISARLTAVGGSVDAAENRAQTLTDKLSDTYDATISEVNRGSDMLDNTIHQLDGVTEDLIAVSETTTSALDALEGAMNDLNNGPGGNVFDQLSSAASDTQSAADRLKTSADAMRAGMEAIQTAVQASPIDTAGISAGVDQISDAYESAKPALDSLKSAMTHLSNAMASTKAASAKLQTAMDYLGDASVQLTTALRDTETLLNYLDAQEKLQFPTLHAKEESNALYDSLHTVSNNIELLNKESKASSDIILEDVRQINRQFTALMDTLLDAVEDIEGASASTVVKDTSDEDIDAVVEGKVLLCRNAGTVSGDIDVGGVAGAMMVYNELDPENDSDSVSSRLRRRYELKCVLQDCTNTGAISGKRDNVGAVCGSETLGVIRGCEAYGSAASDGDCVGGVAGFADGIVRRSWAKCSLSGVKYVGGIVGGGKADGSGLRLEGCRSLVEITEASQYVGAVIGAECGTLSDNRFVSDTLAGIDRVSRRGAAEPIAYEELLTENGLPQEFRSFELSFYANDELIHAEPFRYGDSFGDEVFPEIPPLEGQYAHWDRTDLTNLRFDTVVTAVYAPSVTAVASAATRSAGRAAFFTEGHFTDEDAMEATPAVFDFDDAQFNPLNRLRAYRRTVLEQWQLTLPDDGAESHTVRYLPPEGAEKHLELYLLQNGAWTRLNAGTMGSYLTFDAPGGEAQLTVLSTATPWWVWLMLGAFLLEVLMLLAALLIRKKTVEDPETAAQRKKKLRRLRVTLLAATLALGVALGVVLRLAPAIHNGMSIYTMLRNYGERTDMEMELTLHTQVEDRAFDTNATIYAMPCGDKKVSCVMWQDIPIYYCDDTLLLENGRAYRALGVLPDYSQLLHLAAGLYNSADVTLTEENDVKRYHAVAEGEAAKRLLAVLLSDSAAPETERVTLDLIVRDGELSSISAAWSGDAGAADAELVFRDSDRVRELPQAVRSAVESGEYARADEIGEDARRLLTAWVELVTRDPLSADVTLNADCGPLLLDETLLWQRTRAEGKTLSALTRRGSTVYFTSDAVAASDGHLMQTGRDTLETTPALLHLVYETLLSGSAEGTQTNSGWRYTITPDESAMADFAAAIAPDTETLGVRFSDGTVRIDLTGGSISAVTVRCQGSVRVVRSDVTAQLSAKLRFTDEAFPEPSAAVREALALN